MIRLAPDDIREVSRWAVCGALILAIHGGAAAVLANWSETAPPGEPDAAIMLELAPEAASPTLEHSDLPIAPPQEQTEPDPKPDPVEKVAKEPEQKVEEPPPPPAAVALPEPEKKPNPKPEPKRKVQVATAPEAAPRLAPRAVAPMPGIGNPNPNAMPSWKGLISAHLQSHKSYPPGARSRREEGTAVLSFTLNRQGHVLAASIAHGSGFAELDQETLSMVRRAQPFPAPPPEVHGQQFPFTVPLRYYLR